MKILVSNDDGIYAPGINALANALKTIAQVIVVAPDRDRSAASNSLTLRVPLRARTLENGYISVEGTPTDCIHLAITGLLNDQPDIVVSGINDGANLGDDVVYSGTVAAAMEGRFLGSASIAISLVGSPAQHFATAAAVAKNLVLGLLANPLPSHTMLNVNVPDIPIEKIRGYEITRLGKRHPSEPTIEDTDPRGKKIYWVGPPGLAQDAGPGTDFFAIQNCKVSVTPLQLDMTHYQAFDHLARWISNCDLQA